MSPAAMATGIARVSWGGRKVKWTVERPAGMVISWKRPVEPLRIGTGLPLTTALHPGMYWTRLTRVDGWGQFTVALSQPVPMTVHAVGTGSPDELATAVREKAAAAEGSCQISANPSW